VAEYEFRVAGSVGPVIRSAMSELTTTAEHRQTVLTGATGEPADINDMLALLGRAGLIPSLIVLSDRQRWIKPPLAADSKVDLGTGPATDDAADTY